jgi:hypothetical protein
MLTPLARREDREESLLKSLEESLEDVFSLVETVSSRFEGWQPKVQI